MSTLYELSDNYLYILDLLSDEDVTANPETAETLKHTFESLDVAFDDKVEGYVHVANELKGQESLLDDEIKRLKKRKQAITNNIKALKEVLTNEMDVTGKTKIKTALYTIYTQNNPESVSVLTEEYIPQEYFEPQPPKLDKQKLKKALQSGAEIEGVQLTQGRGVRWR